MALQLQVFVALTGGLGWVPSAHTVARYCL